MDEKGITLNHKSPQVVAASDTNPQAVTSAKSQTTTILGCGSASGIVVPPYFVFMGLRVRDELPQGSTPGAASAVSESGWSNGQIFF